MKKFRILKHSNSFLLNFNGIIDYYTIIENVQNLQEEYFISTVSFLFDSSLKSLSIEIESFFMNSSGGMRGDYSFYIMCDISKKENNIQSTNQVPMNSKDTNANDLITHSLQTKSIQVINIQNWFKELVKDNIILVICSNNIKVEKRFKEHIEILRDSLRNSFKNSKELSQKDSPIALLPLKLPGNLVPMLSPKKSFLIESNESSPDSIQDFELSTTSNTSPINISNASLQPRMKLDYQLNQNIEIPFISNHSLIHPPTHPPTHLSSRKINKIASPNELFSEENSLPIGLHYYSVNKNILNNKSKFNHLEENIEDSTLKVIEKISFPHRDKDMMAFKKRTRIEEADPIVFNFESISPIGKLRPLSRKKRRTKLASPEQS